MISKNIAIIFAIVISWSLTCVDTSRILGLCFAPIPSHVVVHSAIWKGLVERGHDVTAVTTIPIENHAASYSHIIANIPGFLEKFQEHMSKWSDELRSELWVPEEFQKFLMENAAKFVMSNEVQSLMNEAKFDLVIVGYLYNELHLGIAAHFDCPAVLVWVNHPLTNLRTLIKNPWELLYVPGSNVSPDGVVTAFGRIINFLLALCVNLQNALLSYDLESYYNKIFSYTKYPSYKDVVENVPLVLVNHYFTEGFVGQNTPKMVEIGGIQSREYPNPLPKNLQEFLDDASEHGAIYCNLEMHANASNWDLETIQKIYNVLSSLPQKIIWKWDIENVTGNYYYNILRSFIKKHILGEDTQNFSQIFGNILFSKWLPQDDILAHPNVRLFITNGGLGSISEAKHHAIPIIGIPLFGDQYMNLEKVHQQGWCRIVYLSVLTENNFREAVEDVLESPTYKKTIKEVSRVFKDRPMTPLRTAIFWIEYVIRNNGVPYTQAVKMGFIEYYSIDVVIVIYLVYCFMKMVMPLVYWISKLVMTLFGLFIYLISWICKVVISLVYEFILLISHLINKVINLVEMIINCITSKSNKKD